jgi:hypothetical protein
LSVIPPPSTDAISAKSSACVACPDELRLLLSRKALRDRTANPVVADHDFQSALSAARHAPGRPRCSETPETELRRHHGWSLISRGQRRQCRMSATRRVPTLTHVPN